MQCPTRDNFLGGNASGVHFVIQMSLLVIQKVIRAMQHKARDKLLPKTLSQITKEKTFAGSKSCD